MTGAYQRMAIGHARPAARRSNTIEGIVMRPTYLAVFMLWYCFHRRVGETGNGQDYLNDLIFGSEP